MTSQIQASGNHPSRRDFVRGAAVAGAVAVAASSIAPFVHAAENNTLKIGLIGCGNRGGGAAVQALKADSNAKLVALGDMFPDKLDISAASLAKNAQVGGQVDVKQKFSGWDAYKGVIDMCDVVLLATPPHFRPMHLKAAVEAGKQIFCEKPVAVDAPGLRSVMDTVVKAKEKNLSLVSGLCYRYHAPKIEIVKRIQDGACGQITALQAHYLTTGLWSTQRKPEWSDMEWQLRNWLYFTWLSGDLIVEQHIHSLDKILWLMNNEMPVHVQASGGRACRTAPIYGNVYDHFNTIYEWKSGIRCFAAARQWDNVDNDINDWVFGTDGRANLQTHQIWDKNGKNILKLKDLPINAAYEAEHVALFKSIRNNEAINNGDYMCKATGMALMGRTAAYTGKTITWEQMLKSKEDLSPPKYEFGPLEIAPIAVPGKTKFA